MKIQVNSNRSVTMSAGFNRFVKAEAGRVLDRFAPRVTRVEVHLSDVNSRKRRGVDKRCTVEARPAGSRPVSVTATATTVEAAVGGALGKMSRYLATAFSRGRTLERASSTVKPAVRRETGAAKSTAGARLRGASRRLSEKAGARKSAAKKAATSGRSPNKAGPRRSGFSTNRGAA